MHQEQNNCPNCGAGLVWVNSSPSRRHTRTLLFKIASNGIYILALVAIMQLVNWALGGYYGIVLFFAGIIVLGVLVKKRIIKQGNVVSTYKCEGCSRYYAFNEDVGIDP